MKVCLECGQGELVRETRSAKFEYKGQAFAYDQPGAWCQNCAEVFLEQTDKEATDPLITDFIAKVDGKLTTGDIRRIRKKLGLTQKEAGELIGGGPNAFSRYETGKAHPTRGAENFLRILDKHPHLLEELTKPEAA